MLASRGYNIDSLAVGETEDPNLSRMTFVVVGDDRILDQVRKQLEKIVTVVHVDDVSSRDHVERDLMLLKVDAPPGNKRSEIRELVEIFRARIVDVGPTELMRPAILLMPTFADNLAILDDQTADHWIGLDEAFAAAR